MDKDPKLRRKREQAERSYEENPEENPFKSKRPNKFYENLHEDPSTAAEAHQQLKWIKRFK